MRWLALLLLTGCADAVRNGYDTGPAYRNCMRRIGVAEDDGQWTEADKVCRQQARRAIGYGSSSPATTVCKETASGSMVCETYE